KLSRIREVDTGTSKIIFHRNDENVSGNGFRTKFFCLRVPAFTLKNMLDEVNFNC
ncbi:unnamed protein product, partial [Musa hybrid cultivar]